MTPTDRELELTALDSPGPALAAAAPAGAAPAPGASPRADSARLAALAAALQTLDTRRRALLRAFHQRSERERVMLIGAAAALALLAADWLWLGPAQARWQAARAERQAADQSLTELQEQISRLGGQGRQQMRQREAAMAQARQQLRDGETALRQHEDSLVGPDRMLGLLEQLIEHQGALRVRALRSLGRTDVLAGPTGAGSAGTAALPATAVAAAEAASSARAALAAVTGTSQAATREPQPATADAGASGLYRHGVELELEGSYGELLAYLRAIEALPQRVLWGGVALKVVQHPTAVMTLRVYTLSRERHWLEI